MSDLLDIQTHLQDTIATLSRLHSDLAKSPTAPGLLLELTSLEKRKTRLESEFLAAASSAGKEVVQYRLIPENGNATVAGVASVLGDFQQVFSVFYYVIKSGIKQRARVSAEALAKTTLTLGYVFPGSIGFALTVSDEKDLFVSDVDQTIKEIGEVAKSADSESVLAFARRRGVAQYGPCTNGPKIM